MYNIYEQFPAVARQQFSARRRRPSLSCDRPSGSPPTDEGRGQNPRPDRLEGREAPYGRLLFGAVRVPCVYARFLDFASSRPPDSCMHNVTWRRICCPWHVSSYAELAPLSPHSTPSPRL